MVGTSWVGEEKAGSRTLIRSGMSTTLLPSTASAPCSTKAQAPKQLNNRRIAVVFMLDLRSFHTTTAPKLQTQTLRHVQQHFAREHLPSSSGHRDLL